MLSCEPHTAEQSSIVMRSKRKDSTDDGVAMKRGCYLYFIGCSITLIEAQVQLMAASVVQWVTD